MLCAPYDRAMLDARCLCGSWLLVLSKFTTTSIVQQLLFCLTIKKTKKSTIFCYVWAADVAHWKRRNAVRNRWPVARAGRCHRSSAVLDYISDYGGRVNKHGHRDQPALLAAARLKPATRRPTVGREIRRRQKLVKNHALLSAHRTPQK